MVFVGLQVTCTGLWALRGSSNTIPNTHICLKRKQTKWKVDLIPLFFCLMNIFSLYFSYSKKKKHFRIGDAFGIQQKDILKFDEMFALFHKKYHLTSTNGLTQSGLVFCFLQKRILNWVNAFCSINLSSILNSA